MWTFFVSLRKSFCNLYQNLVGTALCEGILVGPTRRRGASSARWEKRAFLCGHASAASVGVPWQHQWVYLSSISDCTNRVHECTSTASKSTEVSSVQGCILATSMGVPQLCLWGYLSSICECTSRLPVRAAKPGSGKRTACKKLFTRSNGPGPQHWMAGLRNGFYTPSPSRLDTLQKPLLPLHDRSASPS